MNEESPLMVAKKLSYIAFTLMLIAGAVSYIFTSWVGISCLVLSSIFILFCPSILTHEIQLTKSESVLENPLEAELVRVNENISNLTQELNETKAKAVLYRTVLDLIPDWIYVKDKAHNYIFANQSFQHAIPDLKIGYSDDKFMPADFCQKIWRDEQVVIQTGKPIQDAEEQAADTWFSTTKVQWNDSDSMQTLGIIGVTRNVTETVTNRNRVEESSDLIKQKIDRVYSIQSDTEQVRESASECSGVVDKMTDIIAEINTGNDKIEDTIVLIKGLASQSKLLSINAAIEAAKAGDSGRGFGVVAHEVRELAERSEQAVTEIQAAINASSQVIKTGTGTMEATNKAFNVSIQQIEHIALRLNGLSDDLKQIS